MTVGIRCGNITAEVGTPDFFHAFFSTTSYHLEKEGWATRFPAMMRGLYHGHLPAERAEDALSELRTVERELAQYSPEEVVWDIEDLDAEPPWGDNISKEITDLGNYFVTSTGRDLIGVIRRTLERAAKNNQDVNVVRL